ncbi:hypothetical protein VNO77_26684 [Canavalia gladiata]|uniref:Uncharacterized protein n=1 Tax=Canavalia gladiata TaxID=3824 RepID=A0AAN9KTI2_CANGL
MHAANDNHHSCYAKRVSRREGYEKAMQIPTQVHDERATRECTALKWHYLTLSIRFLDNIVVPACPIRAHFDQDREHERGSLRGSVEKGSAHSMECTKYTDLDLYLHPHKLSKFLVSILALHLHPSCDSLANLNELGNMSDAGWRMLKLQWRESHVDAVVDLFNICFEGPARRIKKEENIPCKSMHKMADHVHFCLP